MSDNSAFSKEQTAYLQGLTMGADVARAVRGLPVLSGSAGGNGAATAQIGGGNSFAAMLGRKTEGPHLPPEAQASIAKLKSEGKKLSGEEKAKLDKDALELWPEIVERAKSNVYPKGTDVFLTKFYGLFYVAPAQDVFMCRMRIPGGALTGSQLTGIGDLVEKYAAGHADCTTRANIQFREIPAANTIDVLIGLRDLGIITMGSGADNIRNVTASSLSGIDPTEICETLPIAKKLHHHILHRKVMYGMPRKFNIAFDGGGRISALAETNDISFHAVTITDEDASEDCPSGIYYLFGLGGITGHGDFSRPTGVLVREDECIELCEAVCRVFVSHGDRTDRNKARLKYVLDAWGFDKFLEELEKVLDKKLRRVAADRFTVPQNIDRWAHVDVHPQAQAGMNYAGVVLPVARMTSDQMRGLGRIANRYGSGDIRLTVWQNLLVPNIPDAELEAVKQQILALGLDYQANSVRAGLVACTGNAGCKFAASNTKSHAMQIAEYASARVELDMPVNIHVTGCHNSCAQHAIGDIGLLGCKVEVGEEMVEGYHIWIGGITGENPTIAKQVIESVAFPDIPPMIVNLLEAYLETRIDGDETFARWSARHDEEALRKIAILIAVEV